MATKEQWKERATEYDRMADRYAEIGDEQASIAMRMKADSCWENVSFARSESQPDEPYIP